MRGAVREVGDRTRNNDGSLWLSASKRTVAMKIQGRDTPLVDVQAIDTG